MTTLKGFYRVLEQIMTNKESVLIIAEDFDSEVLDTLVLNKIKAGFKVCAVKVPRLNKEAIITDIAVVTDSCMLNDTISEVMPHHLGSAEKIIIDKHHTTIINGSASKLNYHIKQLKEQGEEELNAQTLMTQMELFSLDSSSLFMLDNNLAKRKYSEPDLSFD